MTRKLIQDKLLFVSVESDYTANYGELVVYPSGTHTVSLKTAVGKAGYFVEILNNGNGEITINPFGSELMNEFPTLTLINKDWIYLVSDGTNWVIKSSNLMRNFNFELSKGNIPRLQDFSTFASNVDLDVGTEFLWKHTGLWTPLPTAQTITFSSTSANDTIAGTGARLLLISGVDANYELQNEVIATNGVTPVATVNSWLGINMVTVISAGTGKKNEGVITFSGTVSTTVQSIIAVGDSLSSAMKYHVPMGYTLFLKDFLFIVYKSAGSSPNVTIEGYFVTGGVEYRVYESNIVADTSPVLITTTDGYFPVTEGSYIYFNATTDVNNTITRSAMSGILKQN